MQRARPELHWAGQAEVSRVRTDKNEKDTSSSTGWESRKDMGLWETN